MKSLYKNQSAFTIIEVMIVLAIAGVMLIAVFLAVPALQRNNRTSQRNNDASKILAAVNECLTNKNNQVASCDTVAEVDVFLDRTKLSQLTEASNAAQITTNAQTTARTAAGSQIDNTWRVSYRTRCDDDGDSANTGIANTNDRQYAIMYGIENTAGNTVVRCLQG